MAKYSARAAQALRSSVDRFDIGHVSYRGVSFFDSSNAYPFLNVLDGYTLRGQLTTGDLLRIAAGWATQQRKFLLIK